MQKAKPTIHDVAARAGVSIKTVSRVVNKEPSVRLSTRDRVMAAVQDLDYRPNPAARGLAGRRSFTVGMLYENPKEFGYLQHVLSGAHRACTAAGYSLVLCPCPPVAELDIEEIRHFLVQTRVDGVVLPAPLVDAPAVTGLLADLGVPLVQIAPRKADDRWPAVRCDDRHAARQVTDHLIELGHQRIGVVLGHPDHGAAVQRKAGVRDSLKAHGMEVDKALWFQGYFDFESGKAGAEALLALPDRPTAIFAANDDMAAGVIHHAFGAGLSVPGDLSVVGFDDTPTATHIWPALTTVRQPIEAMAAQATELLIKTITGGLAAANVVEQWRCELVMRGSAAPCTATA